MSVGTFVQPDHLTQSGTEYKLAIKNSIMALARMAGPFAPHEQSSPNMTVRIDAGAVLIGSTPVEVSSGQNTAAMSPPVTNNRIDRVVVAAANGIVSVITGAEAASPAAPDIPSGYLPVAQVLITPSTTEITNSDITDERGPFVSVDSTQFQNVAQISISAEANKTISSSLESGIYLLTLNIVQNTATGTPFLRCNNDSGLHYGYWHHYYEANYRSIDGVSGIAIPYYSGIIAGTKLAASFIITCNGNEVNFNGNASFYWTGNPRGNLVSGWYHGSAEFSRLDILTDAGTMTGDITLFRMG
jgi:hypothetical protein